MPAHGNAAIIAILPMLMLSLMLSSLTAAASTGCPAEDGWPAGKQLTSYRHPCPAGMVGEMTRVCMHTGWRSVNRRGCKANPCGCANQNDGWGCATVDSVAKRACPDGFRGVMTRSCSSNGRWSEEDQSDCRPLRGPDCACDHDGVWGCSPKRTTQTRACPAPLIGDITRRCSVTGKWLDVKDEKCRSASCACAPSGDWPCTAESSRATLPCPSGMYGTRTRICMHIDVWLSETNNCRKAECACNDSVFGCAADGTTATAPCVAPMTGERTRTCVAGKYLDIDESNCARPAPKPDKCLCKADGDWPCTTQIANTLPCFAPQVGQRERLCLRGKWLKESSSNCRPPSCACRPTLSWPCAAAGTTVALPCPSPMTGEMTLRCEAGDGKWSETTLLGLLNVDRSACRDPPPEPACDCVALDGFPCTYAGQTAVRTCDVGAGTATRKCLARSIWGDIDTSKCNKAVRDIDCEVTYDYGPCSVTCGYGQRQKRSRVVRPSSGNGKRCRHSLSVEPCSSTCRAQPCPSIVGWPQTAPGNVAKSPCGAPMTGEITLRCEADGKWSMTTFGLLKVDSSACRLTTRPSCRSERGWPETTPGDVAMLPCQAPKQGYLERRCGFTGMWQEVADHCRSPVAMECAAEAGFPPTQVGKVASSPCLLPLTGARTRACDSKGTWGKVIDNCLLPPGVKMFCSPVNEWLSAQAGTRVSLPCEQPGAMGMRERLCETSGRWGPVVDMCVLAPPVRPTCAADGVWPSTDARKTHFQGCQQADAVGAVSRTCDSDGVWQPEVDTCVVPPPVRPPCFADGVWRSAVAGETLSLPCLRSGWTGALTRMCDSDGLWQPVVDTCVSLSVGLRTCMLPDRRAGLCLSAGECGIRSQLSGVANMQPSAYGRCDGHAAGTVCCTDTPLDDATTTECEFADGRPGLCTEQSMCVGSIESGRCPKHGASVKCCTGDLAPVPPADHSCSFRDGRPGQCLLRSACAGTVQTGRCPHLLEEVCCDQKGAPPPSLDETCEIACTTQSGDVDQCMHVCTLVSLEDTSQCLPGSLGRNVKVTDDTVREYLSCSLGYALQQGPRTCKAVCKHSFGTHNSALLVRVCTSICDVVRGDMSSGQSMKEAAALAKPCLDVCAHMPAQSCVRGCALGVGMGLVSSGL